MPKAHVTVAPEAIAEAIVIADRWRRARPSAPRLFVIELDRALLLLADQPAIGRRVRASGRPRLRVLTLQRTRYLVFYEERPDLGDVVITRIRHGHRRPLARHRR